MNKAEVSIVIPTCNRLPLLRRCVERVREQVGVRFQMIVVDGDSTDGTRPWLAGQKDIRVILEERREGAVKAFNKGFRQAETEYVMWLNDDAFPLPGAVEAALTLLCRPHLTDLGMVGFYHNWDSTRNLLHTLNHEGESYGFYHVRGTPYANFGLLRTRLLADAGYFDERYRFFGADPDLSLKLQLDLGLAVIGCPSALVHHDEYHDERKVSDLPTGHEDNEKLFAKWRLPAAGSYPDPAPAYQRMLVRRGILAAAICPETGMWWTADQGGA